MTQLKTLKDLLIKSNFINDNKEIMIVQENKLKAEAVKWVKELRKTLIKGFDDRTSTDIMAFKKFFNLTTKDLK